MIAVGDRVRTVGLEGRPELNGAMGVVESYHESKGRFRVRLIAVQIATPLAIKPENLVKVEISAVIGRCDGLGAFNMALYDENVVARVTLRVHEGLSPVEASCDITPKATLLEVAAQFSGRPCASVLEAIEAVAGGKPDSNRDRDYTVEGKPPSPRRWHVSCPPALAGSVLANARSLTSADVLQRTETTETSTHITQAQTLEIAASMAGPVAQSLSDFVDSWTMQPEAITLKGVVAKFNLETAAYCVFNRRGEYRNWGFGETLKELFRAGYKARRQQGSSDSIESLRQRAREILGALVSDTRLGAQTCVAKCDLMCEHMVALHLLSEQKLMAALLLCLRDNLREVGLKDSAFGTAMMLFSPPLPDGTYFMPLAEKLLERENTSQEIFGTFTALPLAKVLEIHHKEMNANGGIGLRTQETEEGSLTLGEGTEDLDEDLKQRMRDEYAAAANKGKNAGMEILKISDYAHIDEEAGFPDGGGHHAAWSMHCRTDPTSSQRTPTCQVWHM